MGAVAPRFYDSLIIACSAGRLSHAVQRGTFTTDRRRVVNDHQSRSVEAVPQTEDIATSINGVWNSASVLGNLGGIEPQQNMPLRHHRLYRQRMQLIVFNLHLDRILDHSVLLNQ